MASILGPYHTQCIARILLRPATIRREDSVLTRLGEVFEIDRLYADVVFLRPRPLRLNEHFVIMHTSIACEAFPPPSLMALPKFMEVIEERRRLLNIDVWKSFCRFDMELASWRRFLLEDPYTSHGLTKPRGYPGDASLMDFAYNHESVSKKLEEASEIGRKIYAVTSTAQQSLSARRRIDLIARLISEAIEERGHFRFASFAAGHARELERLSHLSAKIESFNAIDSDTNSLAEIKKCYSSRFNLKLVAKNVFRLHEDELPHVEFAYSLGLFDYLADVAAQRVLRVIAQSVRAGGTLVIGNLSSSAANLGYCESIMDWWMVPRSFNDMEQLGAYLDTDGEWRFEVVEEGCFLYLRARRLGHD